MNYIQNKKIAQISSQTLIIGVDMLNSSMWPCTGDLAIELQSAGAKI